MPPGHDHVGLGTQASQIGERGQHGVDQFAGHGTVAVRQAAGKHFGQGPHRLALTVAAALGIEPMTVVTEKIVEPPADPAGMLQET